MTSTSASLLRTKPDSIMVVSNNVPVGGIMPNGQLMTRRTLVRTTAPALAASLTLGAADTAAAPLNITVYDFGAFGTIVIPAFNAPLVGAPANANPITIGTIADSTFRPSEACTFAVPGLADGTQINVTISAAGVISVTPFGAGTWAATYGVNPLFPSSVVHDFGKVPQWVW